jgi:hypothetical protein
VSDLNQSENPEDLSDDRAPFAELAALADTDLPARGARPVVREGLPPSYRMRADAHYVDQLSAPAPAREQFLEVRSIESAPVADAPPLGPLTESIRKHGVLQPLLVRRVEGRYRVIDGTRRLSAAIAAGLARVPCRLHDVGDDEAAALALAANDRPAPMQQPPPAPHGWRADVEAELARTLGSLGVCTRMLGRTVSSFSRDAAATLIQAEVGRASALVQAERLLQGGAAASRTRVRVRRIVELALHDVEAERLLNNVQIEDEFVAASEPSVAGDEAQLTLAVAAALRATFGLLEGVGTARAAINVSSDGDWVSIVVWQVAAAPADDWRERAFDPAWTGRPGGIIAASAMRVLQYVAAAHGGTAAVDATGRGTRIALTLPAAR